MLNKYKVLREAERFVASRHYGKAIQEYQRFLKAEGDDPSVLNTLGDVMLRAGRPKDAIQQFRRVVQMFRDSGFVAKAAAVANKIYQHVPNDSSNNAVLVELYAERGLVSESCRFLKEFQEKARLSGDLSLAISFSRQLVEFQKTDASAHSGLGDLLREIGETSEARDAYLAAARIWVNKENLSRAGQVARMALSLDKDSQEAKDLLARAEGQPIELPAAALGSAALTESIDALVEPLAIRSTGGMDSPADSLGPEVFSLESEEQDTVDLSVDTLPIEESDLDEWAVDGIDLNEIPELEPVSVLDQQELLGDEAPTYLADEDGAEEFVLDLADRGEETSEGALKALESDALESLLQEADFYVKLDMHEDAVRVVEQLAADYPNDERVRNRAQALGLSGENTPQAVEPETSFEIEVEAALENLFVPENSVLEGVAEVKVEEDAVELRGDNPREILDLGMAYREMGMMTDAAEKFEEAIGMYQEIGDSQSATRLISLLTAAYVATGKFEQAVEWANKGLSVPELEGVDWKALEFDRAHSYEMLGDHQHSLEGFRRIYAEDPSYRDVKDRIDRTEE